MRQAWIRLKRHWVRHLLAALQVAVAVALMTAVFVDAMPAVRQSVGSGAAEVFQLTYGGTTPDGGRFWTSAFQTDDVAFAEDELMAVQAASIYDEQLAPLVRVGGDLFLVRSAAKVSPGYAEIADLSMVAGRFFTAEDVARDEPRVVVLSSSLAALMFPDGDVLGSTVNWRPHEEGRLLRGFGTFGRDLPEGTPGTDLTVIGVYEAGGGGGWTASLSSGTMGPADMLIPATGQWRYMSMRTTFAWDDDAGTTEWVSELSGETYQHLVFRAYEGRGVEALAEVETVLGERIRARRGDLNQPGDDMPHALVIEPIAEAASAGARFQLQSVLMLGAMSVAALVVAGFSVFTTFLAGVAERTRSIGLARALGATRGRIVREVVGEAVLLTGVGGVIGAILAYPVRTYVMASVIRQDVIVGPLDVAITIAAAWMLAMGIGALAALYPGWSVASLMPSRAFEEDGR